MIIRIDTLVVLAITCLLAACSGPIAGLPPGEVNNQARLRMAEWHNELRAGNGVGALVTNGKLMQIAQQQAEYNAFKGRLEHTDGSGGLVRDRATVVGYNGQVAENLGYALSATEVFDDWVSSGSHFSTMIDSDFTDIGVGQATSGIYEFWVVVFGTP